MNYELTTRVTRAGRTVPTVRIGGNLYPLICTGGKRLDEFAPRQRRQIEDGGYGAEVAAYAAACREAGVPCTGLGWTGVVNGLGDYGSVSLPRPVEDHANAI